MELHRFQHFDSVHIYFPSGKWDMGNSEFQSNRNAPRGGQTERLRQQTDPRGDAAVLFSFCFSLTPLNTSVRDGKRSLSVDSSVSAALHPHEGTRILLFAP